MLRRSKRERNVHMSCPSINIPLFTPDQDVATTMQDYNADAVLSMLESAYLHHYPHT